MIALLSLLGPALAASPSLVDCETGEVVSQVEATEPLCASGRTDSSCGAGLYLLESGAPGLVDVRAVGPSSVSGDFERLQLAAAPLATGTFDLVIDENCDGLRSATDPQASGALVVPAQPVSGQVDPAGFLTGWQARAAEWESLAERWVLHQSSLLLGDTPSPVWVQPGGNPALLLLWTPDGASVVPVETPAAALWSSAEDLAAALVFPADALSSSPTDSGIDLSAVRDLGYPFFTAEDEQNARGRAYLASGFAEAGALLVGLHETLFALDTTTDNTEAARLARTAQVRADTLTLIFHDLVRASRHQVNATSAVPAATVAWEPASLNALQERVAREGWSPEEQTLLSLHGIEEDRLAEALLATPVPDTASTLQETLLALKDSLEAAAATTAALSGELETLAAEHETWSVRHDPGVVLEGPFFGRVGYTHSLSVDPQSPRDPRLSLSWELDGDVVADETEDNAAVWSPTRPSRSLLRLEARDDRGVSVEAYATLEAEPGLATSRWLERGPETTLVVRQAGSAVSFLAVADAGTGLPLHYTFSLDGTDQETREPSTADAPAYWDWLPDDSDVGLHYVEVLARDPTGNRADLRSHWAIEIVASASGDGGSDGSTTNPDPFDPQDTGEPGEPRRSRPEEADRCGGSGSGAMLPFALLCLGLRRRR